MKYLPDNPSIGLLLSLGLSLGTAPVSAQCWTESAQVAAPSPRNGGQFGRSVALCGDTLVVGEVHGTLYACPSSSLVPSFVHVFERDQGGPGAWGAIRTLDGPVGCSNGIIGFGMAVALDGDTLALGLPGAGNEQEGEVHVFERDVGGPDNWGQTATLVPSDYLCSGQFGRSLALSGDTLVIGAEGLTAVYVFERSLVGANWTETVKLAPPGTYIFGHGVDVSGDTIVVGSSAAWFAPGEAFVYERNLGGPGAWGEAARFVASDGTAGDYFGLAVAIDGDLVLVGAENALALSGIGAVYAFERDLGGPGSWGERRKIISSDGAGSFGWSLSLSETTAVIGAYAAPHPEGAAYVHARDLGGVGAWGQVQKLLPPPGNGASRYFSESVSISGGTAVASAPNADFREWANVTGLAFDPGTGRLLGSYGYAVQNTLSLDPSTVGGVNLGSIGFEKVFGMAFDPVAGVLYATSVKGPDQLVTIDAATGAGTAVGLIGFNNIQGLAFDPLAGVLYGADRTTDQLIVIDTTTGAGTALGYFESGYGDVRGLAFDPQTGVLYGVDQATRTLLDVDPATGLATAVGTFGNYDVESLAFDPLSGTLYGTDVVTEELLVFDTQTGASTAVQKLYVSAAGAAVVFDDAVPTLYCTAGASASGCTAGIAGAGVPSASQPAGFTLSASGVEGGRDGLFFFGTSGRQANPWGNGASYQCVAPPVRRSGLMNGGGASGSCGGAFALDLNAHWASVPAQNPGAAAVVQAQLWYRDPLNTSNQTTSLSDAIEFKVGP